MELITNLQRVKAVMHVTRKHGSRLGLSDYYLQYAESSAIRFFIDHNHKSGHRAIKYGIESALKIKAAGLMH